MAKTVRDILMNVDSGDLLFSAGDMSTHLFFNIEWGSLFNNDSASTLYANIIIPSRKLSKLVVDDQGRYLVYAKATYYPYDTQFIVRLVLDNNGTYEKIQQSNCAFPIESRAYFPDSQMRINASEMPYVNIDGNYLFKLEFGNNNNNNAYVYTADSTDLLIGGSDLQASQFLAICEPGKYYRYPTTGIGAMGFIGSVVHHTDLGDKIIEQFKDNGVSVQDAEFNSRTGELQVIFFNEGVEDEEDLNLLDVSEIDISEIDVSDADIEAAASNIDLGDYDIDYDALLLNTPLPDAFIESCFANGIWISSYPWTRDKYWKE